MRAERVGKFPAAGQAGTTPGAPWASPPTTLALGKGWACASSELSTTPAAHTALSCFGTQLGAPCGVHWPRGLHGAVVSPLPGYHVTLRRAVQLPGAGARCLGQQLIPSFAGGPRNLGTLPCALAGRGSWHLPLCPLVHVWPEPGSCHALAAVSSRLNPVAGCWGGAADASSAPRAPPKFGDPPALALSESLGHQFQPRRKEAEAPSCARTVLPLLSPAGQRGRDPPCSPPRH